MKKLKMKIVDYDAESNSVIVAFASENSKNPIDYYPTCAYQSTMFDNPSDTEAVFEEIARAGVAIAMQQDKEDNFKADKILEKNYKPFVGKEFEYDIENLINKNQILEGEIQVPEIYDSLIDDILKEILIDDNETIEVDLDDESKQ